MYEKSGQSNASSLAEYSAEKPPRRRGRKPSPLFEERRQEVLEAVWRAILNRGLDRTSIREIATELGATTGTVSHYFRSRDEIVLFALERLMASTKADFAAALEGTAGMKRLEVGLLTLLPTTKQSLAEWKIWVSFRGYALTRPELAASCRQSLAEMRQILRLELKGLRDLELIRTDLNLDQLTDIVVAFYGGLGLESTTDPASYPPEHQRKVVEDFVASFVVRP
ncbi:MAG TPA: TetR/AcrR family transcriptional regulator [Pseudomonas sp.]|nr:TetR/AcrR family transcriptional regulator [Pseudomonas sp.]